MKIECYETDGCFSVNLNAESMQDAAFLARMAKNGKTSAVWFYATVGHNGEFTGGIDIIKRKDYTSSLAR